MMMKRLISFPSASAFSAFLLLTVALIVYQSAPAGAGAGAALKCFVCGGAAPDPCDPFPAASADCAPPDDKSCMSSSDQDKPGSAKEERACSAEDKKACEPKDAAGITVCYCQVADCNTGDIGAGGGGGGAPPPGPAPPPGNGNGDGGNGAATTGATPTGDTSRSSPTASPSAVLVWTAVALSLYFLFKQGY